MSSNIASLIDVFRMEEISKETRANLIVKLGNAINGEFGMNVTEPLVYELVLILNPSHEIITDEKISQHYKPKLQKAQSGKREV